MVDECRLRVVYVSPPRPPSPVQEGSEEGSPLRDSMSENGSANDLEVPNLVLVRSIFIIRQQCWIGSFMYRNLESNV